MSTAPCPSIFVDGYQAVVRAMEKIHQGKDSGWSWRPGGCALWFFVFLCVFFVFVLPKAVRKELAFEQRLE